MGRITELSPGAGEEELGAESVPLQIRDKGRVGAISATRAQAHTCPSGSTDTIDRLRRELVPLLKEVEYVARRGVLPYARKKSPGLELRARADIR
jgi:uncharacterized protein YuzE